MADKKSNTKRTFLTGRQLEIFTLRSEGKSTTEISEIISTTPQNVTILEKRARKNLEKAIETVNAVKDLKIVLNLRIPENTHILDAVMTVIREADKSGIRLKDNVIGILTRLKISVDMDIQNGLIQREVAVMILHNGVLLFY